MNIKYFRDTDTALLELSERDIDETREVSPNVYLDLDKDGEVVSITIEQAAKLASFPQVQVEQIDAGSV